MTDHDALLAAVLADPEDDAPRLVLADWFTENGQEERGAFIRVQCELARVERQLAEMGNPDKGRTIRQLARRVDALRRRERELLKRYYLDWFPEFDGWDYLVESGWVISDGDNLPELVVRRGFIGELRTTLAGFMGGPCQLCGGTGETSRYLLGMPCNCSGTGRTPGAVGVFAREPVTKVIITDAEPWEIRSGKDGFRWFGDDNPDAFSRIGRIRKALVKLMPQHPDYVGDDSGRTVIKSYPTRDAALLALSRAAVNYGRVAAGLSPLPSG